MKETRRLSVLGEEIVYLFEAKRVKNFNLRVRRDGTLTVSAPLRATRREVDAFVTQEAAFIQRARERMRERERAEAPPSDGDTVYYLGKPYTLRVRTGRADVLLEGDTLTLTLPENAPVARTLEKQLALLFYPTLLAVCRQREPFFKERGARGVSEIRLKPMRSMWGNCRAKKGILTFSTMMCALSPMLTDYVVCHEYAHLLHPDHGKGFYALLAEACPDYRERRSALKQKKFDYEGR